MNFVEVLELHKTVTAFYCKTQPTLPRLSVFDALDRGGGYVLCIKEGNADEEHLGFLKEIAKMRGLGIREFRGYLILHSS